MESPNNPRVSQCRNGGVILRVPFFGSVRGSGIGIIFSHVAELDRGSTPGGKGYCGYVGYYNL